MRLLVAFSFVVCSCVGPVRHRQAISRNEPAVVTVPMHFRADAPHVMASLNGGRVLPVLLDTGASVCVLDSGIAALNDVPLTPGGAVRIRGIHGNATAMRAVIRGLDIGAWHSSGVPCFVRNTAGPRFGGLGSAILGVDHLRRQCRFVTIDYRTGRVDFGLQAQFKPLAGAQTARVPFHWKEGLPMIEVRAGSLRWDAVVDTGSSWGIVIDQATAARLGHATDGRGLGRNMVLSGVGGSVSANDAGARIIQVSSVTLCGGSHSPGKLYVMPGPKRVGSEFWHGCRLTLDFESKTLWLER